MQDGYSALQQEKAQIEFAERATKLDFNGLRDLASEKSKLFLDVFRSKLQDPASLRRLLHADSVARSKHTPDTNDYFAEIERLCGFSPEERRFEFENDKPSETKPKPAKKGDSEYTLTPEQKAFVKNLNGITEAEYAAAMKNPFSQAATSVDIADTGIADQGKGMEVSLEPEAPPRKTVSKNYKPGPNAVTLTAAQVKFCQDSGIDVKDYVRSKLAVDKGETSHQWYEARLKSQGLA